MATRLRAGQVVYNDYNETGRGDTAGYVHVCFMGNKTFEVWGIKGLVDRFRGTKAFGKACDLACHINTQVAVAQGDGPWCRVGE